jgi:pimeloyl-ACP methyl ester carboxylesterase
MMFRTRFKREIVAEFLPPGRHRKRQKVVILCDGMPGIPRKQPLAEFLAKKGYWVFYPRYRGAWESDGEFLKRSPHEDIVDVISELPKGLTEAAFGGRFEVAADEIFVIGGSFGGAAAILASLDRRVKKVIANCPVVDWAILGESEKAETSNPSYVSYLREAFGNAYRISEKNWRKLDSGKFYNPAYHAGEIDAAKVMMFHAKDDPYVPWRSVAQFAKKTGVELKLLRRGGHLKTEWVVQRYWKEIERFFGRRD